MNAYEFRCVAFDETAHWDGLPEGCTQVFGIYLFMVDEGMYRCSLFPSSWCEFLENVFIGLDNEHPFVEEHAFDGSDNYFDFIRVDDKKYRLSRPLIVDHDDEDPWGTAREYFRGNSPDIPLP